MSDYQRKAIDGFSGYEIDTEGVVWSCLKRKIIRDNKGRIFSTKTFKSKNWKIMKLRLKRGYLNVKLCIEGKGKYLNLHRLLARHFISNPEKKPCACHKNGNRQDNRIENLYWGTVKENIHDALRHGTMHIGEKSNLSKLTEKQVKDIKRIKNDIPKITQKEISKMFNSSQSNISSILTGKNWKHITI